MISMPNLLDTMLTLSKGDNVAYLRFEQKLRNIPLLLLDDFGAEYSKSDWVPSKVESIIIDRYNRMKFLRRIIAMLGLKRIIVKEYMIAYVVNMRWLYSMEHRTDEDSSAMSV